MSDWWGARDRFKEYGDMLAREKAAKEVPEKPKPNFTARPLRPPDSWKPVV